MGQQNRLLRKSASDVPLLASQTLSAVSSGNSTEPLAETSANTEWSAVAMGCPLVESLLSVLTFGEPVRAAARDRALGVRWAGVAGSAMLDSESAAV